MNSPPIQVLFSICLQLAGKGRTAPRTRLSNPACAYWFHLNDDYSINFKPNRMWDCYPCAIWFGRVDTLKLLPSLSTWSPCWRAFLSGMNAGKFLSVIKSFNEEILAFLRHGTRDLRSRRSLSASSLQFSASQSAGNDRTRSNLKETNCMR